MSGASELVGPPRQGKIRVHAVAATASAAERVQDDSRADAANQSRASYFTFVSDVDLFITFHSADDLDDPDGTSVAGDDRSGSMLAGVPEHWYIDNSARFFKTIGATGLLRYWRS